MDSPPSLAFGLYNKNYYWIRIWMRFLENFYVSEFRMYAAELETFLDA